MRTSAIQYEEVNGLLMDGPILRATHKGVQIDIVEGDDWVSIWTMISTNPGKGECQEMIGLVRQDFPGKTLCGSIPLNPVAQHIFDKCGVDYPRE